MVLGDILSIDYSWGEINLVTHPMDDRLMKCMEPSCCEESSYDIDKAKAEYEEEVKQRWGKTDAYRQSREKSAG